jgi:predicted aspartyl protease
LGLKFQVADVIKPLVSVKRLAEKGNQVCFGPNVGDNFIRNKESGKKVMLKPNGRGSYLMEVCFLNGEETTIVVDSGAEENVCPHWWGDQFGLEEASRPLFLRSAGGQHMHWGQREVLLTATF